MSQRARIPTRVELHRLKFHWSKKTIPLLQFHALDEEEKRLIADEVFAEIKKQGMDSRYGAYIHVLSEWGIVCPHPQETRLYRDVVTKTHSDFPLTNFRYYECMVCECMCINEHFSREVEKRKSL